MMPKPKLPEIAEVTHEKREELLREIADGHISECNRNLISGNLRFVFWLQQSLLEAKISIGRLRKLFGVKTERKPKNKDDKNKEAKGGNLKTNVSKVNNSTPDTEGLNSNSTGENHPKEETDQEGKSSDGGKPRPGHGRIPAAAYTSAKEIYVQHETLQAGDPCPLLCSGSVYKLTDPGIVIRLKGSPIATGEKYLLEKLRCGTCNAIFTAKLPEAEGEHKYDDDLYAILPLLKYGMGLPLLRMETMQRWLGMPLPDATIWDLIEEMAKPCYPIYKVLIELAACGRLVHHDDTLMRILSLLKENKDNPDIERRAIYTSGFVVYTDDRKIYLFFTGRRNAGENLDELLRHRSPALPVIMQMADALAANHTKEFMTILCNCLVHGRRKFHEILDFFPQECHYVLEALALVYKNDAEAHRLELSPQERLEYHQKHSAPVMDRLHEWLKRQMDENLVEPNGSMGKAVKYMLRHWPELTMFLRVVGAPLDNNIAERALKFAIRNRKAAMFYKSQHGAMIGDIFMSLILTCTEAHENPLEYLKALRRNQKLVFADPKKWLPWNFRDNLSEKSEEAALPRPPDLLGNFPPVAGDPRAHGIAVPQQNLQLAGG